MCALEWEIPPGTVVYEVSFGEDNGPSFRSFVEEF